MAVNKVALKSPNGLLKIVALVSADSKYDAFGNGLIHLADPSGINDYFCSCRPSVRPPQFSQYSKTKQISSENNRVGVMLGLAKGIIYNSFIYTFNTVGC